MISPRTRPGRRALVTTATGGRARLGFPALGADPTITASARARPSRLTTVTAAGRLTTGRLTTVPGVPTSAVTGTASRLTTGRLTAVTGAGMPTSAVTGTAS